MAVGEEYLIVTMKSEKWGQRLHPWQMCNTGHPQRICPARVSVPVHYARRRWPVEPLLVIV